MADENLVRNVLVNVTTNASSANATLKSLTQTVDVLEGSAKDMAKSVAEAFTAFQADKSDTNLEKLKNSVANLGKEMKTLGTARKGQELFSDKEIQSVQQLQKALNEMGRYIESQQKWSQMSTGVFGMDKTKIKDIERALKELGDVARSVSGMMNMSGGSVSGGADLQAILQKNQAALQAQAERIRSTMRRGKTVDEAHEQGLIDNETYNKGRDKAAARAAAREEEQRQRQSSKDYSDWWKQALRERDIDEKNAYNMRMLNVTGERKIQIEARNDYVKWWNTALRERDQDEEKSYKMRIFRETEERKMSQQAAKEYAAWWERAIKERETLETTRQQKLLNKAFEGKNGRGAETLQTISMPIGAKGEGQIINTQKQLLEVQRQIIELVDRGNFSQEKHVELLQKAVKLKDQERGLSLRADTDANQIGTAKRMLDKTTGVGGAALMAVQSSLMLNYAVINGAVSAMQTAIRTSIELEAALKNVQAVTTTSNTEMVGLSKTIESVAANSKFTSVEVANAALILGQAGLSAQQIGKSLESVTTLASAAGTSMSNAADLVTSVIGVFDKQATDVPEIVNKITQASNSSKTSVEKLALGLQYAGNTAATVGVSFEETTAALATMSNAGIKSGSTMGTGLNQFLVQLQKPTKEFITTLTQMGLSISDVDVRTKGLAGVLRTLREAGFTATDAIKGFDVRSARAFNALIANPEDFQNQLSGLTNTNAALKAQEIQMDSLKAQSARLTTSLENLAASGFAPLSAALKNIAGGMATVFQFLSELPVIAPVAGTALAAVAGVATLRQTASLIDGFQKLRGATEGTALAAVDGAFKAGSLKAAWQSIVGTSAAVTTAQTTQTAATVANTAAVEANAAATNAAATAAKGMSLATGIGLAIGALTIGWMAYNAIVNDSVKTTDELKAELDKAKGVANEQITVTDNLTKKIGELEGKQRYLKDGTTEVITVQQLMVEQYGRWGYASDSINGKLGDTIVRLKQLRNEMNQIAGLSLDAAASKADALAAQALRNAKAKKDEVLGNSLFGVNSVSLIRNQLNNPEFVKNLNYGGVNREGELRSKLDLAESGDNNALQAVLSLVRNARTNSSNTSKTEFKALDPVIEKLDRFVAALGDSTRADTEAKAARFNKRVFEESKTVQQDTAKFNFRAAIPEGGVNTYEGVLAASVKAGEANNELQRRINKLTSEKLDLEKNNVGVELPRAKAIQGEITKLKEEQADIVRQQKAETDILLTQDKKDKKELNRIQADQVRLARKNGATNEQIAAMTADRAAKEKSLKLMADGTFALTDKYNKGMAQTSYANSLHAQAGGRKGSQGSAVGGLASLESSENALAKSAAWKIGLASTEEEVDSLADKAIDHRFAAHAAALRKMKENYNNTKAKGASPAQLQALQEAIAAEEEKQDELDSTFIQKTITRSEKRKEKVAGITRDIKTQTENINIAKDVGALKITDAGKDQRNLDVALAGQPGSEKGIAYQQAIIKKAEVAIAVHSDLIKQLGDETNGLIGLLNQKLKKLTDDKAKIDKNLAELNAVGLEQLSDEQKETKMRLESKRNLIESEIKKDSTTLRQMTNMRNSEQQALSSSQIEIKIAQSNIPQELTVDNIKQALEDTAKAYERCLQDMNELKYMKDGLVGALKSGTSSLGTALADWASGTKTFKQAFADMTRSVIRNLLDIISQMIAMQMIKAALGFAGMAMAAPASGSVLGSGGLMGSSGTVNLGTGVVSLGKIASGGYITDKGTIARIKHFASGGSVYGGVSGKDSVPSLLMPGEFVMKKSAVDAVGTDYLHALNQQTDKTVSQSGQKGKDQKDDGATVNVWVVTPDQKPNSMGPKDVVAVISDDIMRSGQVKKLIRQVQTGAI